MFEDEITQIDHDLAAARTALTDATTTAIDRAARVEQDRSEAEVAFRQAVLDGGDYVQAWATLHAATAAAPIVATALDEAERTDGGRISALNAERRRLAELAARLARLREKGFEQAVSRWERTRLHPVPEVA